MAPLENVTEDRDRRRLRWFLLHLGTYFVVIAICAVLNFTKTPNDLWFIFPMVAWGAPLAIHAAWAMGLIDGLVGGNNGGNEPPAR